MGFDAELRYEGYGWAEFGEPPIRVRGSTGVTTHERGGTVADMQVAEVPTSDSVEDGIFRLTSDAFEGINAVDRPCTLRVDCANGQFSPNDQVFRHHNINLEKASASIAFRCY